MKSMRLRLAAAFTLGIALVMLLSCAGLVAYARTTARSEADEDMADVLKRLQLKLRAGPVDRTAVLYAASDLATGDIVLLVIDSEGHVIKQTARRAPSWPLGDDAAWRTLSRRFGAYTVVAADPWDEASLRRLTVTLAIVDLIACVCAAAGSWILVGHTLSPIAHLTAQARSTQPPAAQLRPSSQDQEIVELVDTLNDLLRRLAQAAAARGRFYAAASHELRTPLQALSGHLELAASRPRTTDEYRTFVTEALKQTRRLVSLVSDLLLLNRIDSGQIAEQGDVDLVESCSAALAALAPETEQRGLRLDTDMPDDVHVLAPPNHVAMVLRNLLDNAVRYSAPAGDVQVKVRARPPAVDVYNSVDQPPQWNRADAFEPFAPRPGRASGNGLGLAICRAIADANGWTLWLRMDDGRAHAHLEISR